MSLRKVVVWFTVVCFVTTQTASVAGPHEEGVAAGQAANPVARGSVTAPSATGVVPGYTTTPPERSYYRQPNLASQGNARLALCMATKKTAGQNSRRARFSEHPPTCGLS